MVNDGANTTRHQADQHGGRREPPRSNLNSTTPPPSPSRTPRRTRRVATTTPPPSKPPSTSSTVLPPPPPPTSTERMVTTVTCSSVITTTKNPSTSGTRKQKSVICPICKKDMCHEKALCGHIRWHTQAERQAAYTDIARALASNFISGGVHIEHQGSPKRLKLPDLNQPPPPDDDDAA
ncbi:hypothetical protein L6452_40100 [Arctium lappa]|uniref:Uncharacterized protein n=1 Tax=Arctium lappa TaxID=4217 RepID=A0ACB8XMR1_ARCLA|nr:hypothetical protein L6452_40100 [Arctium lappa]